MQGYGSLWNFYAAIFRYGEPYGSGYNYSGYYQYKTTQEYGSGDYFGTSSVSFRITIEEVMAQDTTHLPHLLHKAPAHILARANQTLFT